MTDVTVRGGLVEGYVSLITLKEMNNGRWQWVREGGKIEGGREGGREGLNYVLLGTHMAVDMVNLDCVCGVTPLYREWRMSHMHNHTSVDPPLYFLICPYIPVCIHCIVCIWISWPTFPPWGGKWPAELVLSEGWPHVRLCGRVKIETVTHTNTQTLDRRLCFMLNGFYNPVE